VLFKGKKYDALRGACQHLDAMIEEKTDKMMLYVKSKLFKEKQ